MEFTSLSWSEYLTCLFIIHNNSQNVIYVNMYSILYMFMYIFIYFLLFLTYLHVIFSLYNMSLCVFLSRFNSQIWGWVEQRFGIPGQPCLVSSLCRDVSVGEASPHCDTAMILLKKGVCGWRVELCGSYWVLVHYKVSRLSLSLRSECGWPGLPGGDGGWVDESTPSSVLFLRGKPPCHDHAPLLPPHSPQHGWTHAHHWGTGWMLARFVCVWIGQQHLCFSTKNINYQASLIYSMDYRKLLEFPYILY